MSAYPPPQQPYQQTPPPENHLVFAILTTLFCFWPTGIVAIIKASKVNSLWISGQQAAAMQASAEANKWSKITLWVGVGLAVFWVLISILLIATGAMTASAGYSTSGM